MSASNYTGRFARTMQQGINPYATGPVEPMAEPHHPHDKLVMVGCVVAGLFVAVMVLGRWLPGGGL